MITKAIVHQLDLNKNSCQVRVPLFENAASRMPIILEALISNPPGMYNNISIGDIVFIGFEENKIEKPVILGKMFISAKQESAVQGGNLNCNTLQISQAASIPATTRFTFKKTDNLDYSGLTTPKQLADAILKLDQNIAAASSVGYLTRIYVDTRFSKTVTENAETDLEVQTKPILYGHFYLKTSQNFEEQTKDSSDLVNNLCSYLYQKTSGYLHNKPRSSVFSQATTEEEYKTEQEYFHKPWIFFTEGFSGNITPPIIKIENILEQDNTIEHFECLSGIPLSCELDTSGTFVLCAIINNTRFEIKPEEIRSIQSMPI